jgi:hypothetical protein
MAHTDAMSLKTIDFFLSVSDIDQDIKRLYMEQFVMHKFGASKSQTDKSLDLLSRALNKSQLKSDQTTQSILTLVNQLKKSKKDVDE